MKKHVRKAGQKLWIIYIVLGLLFLCRFEPVIKAVEILQPAAAGLTETVQAVAQDMIGITYSENDAAKKIALTFDDGPHPIYTPELLDGLRERGVVCTFFVTGENATLYPELIEQMKEDGHLVGNHTYHHVQLSTVGEEVFLQELQETNRVLEGILEEEIVFVRPPYGDWTKSVEKEIDMLPVLWDIDPLDWCTGNASKVVKKVLENAEDQSIILMHDYYATSVEAALKIVDELLEDGYEFVTVDEILVE